MNINWAPFYYRKIFADRGGPLQTIFLKNKKIFFDRKLPHGFEATAQLRDDLWPSFTRQHQVYGNFAGTGSDLDKSTACYKAMSEAIERWAYYHIMGEGHQAVITKYGFNLDSSTTGMAAFPTFRLSHARRQAYYEAVERWALAEWWYNNLPIRLLANDQAHLCSYEILTPFSDVSVALLCLKEEFTNVFTLGFAASVDASSAQLKAQIELCRNYHLLAQISTQKKADLDIHPNLPLYEKRLLYYNNRENFGQILEKIERSLVHNIPVINLPSRPNLLTDVRVSGEWNRFGIVWRCLFATSQDHHLDSETMMPFF